MARHGGGDVDVDRVERRVERLTDQRLLRLRPRAPQRTTRAPRRCGRGRVRAPAVLLPPVDPPGRRTKTRRRGAVIVTRAILGVLPGTDARPGSSPARARAGSGRRFLARRAGAAGRRARSGRGGSASSPDEPVDGARPASGPVGHRDRDGAVQLDDRRRVQLLRAGRRARRSAASRSRRRRGARVERGDRGLQLVRPGPRRAERALEQRAGPRRSSRASQRERSWSSSSTSSPVAVDARVAARVVEQHQREQPEHLGLVGHQHGEELRPSRIASSQGPRAPASSPAVAA